MAENTKVPTNEELLARWEELLAALSGATPSAPHWYGIIDVVVGTLATDRIADLKRRIAERQGD